MAAVAYKSPPPRQYLKWLAIDLDGTLAEGVWTPEDPSWDIGNPIHENVRKMLTLMDKGWKVVIHTSRPWHDYENIEGWFKFWGIPFDKIMCGKLLAAAYIDDRAISAFDEEWEPTGHDVKAE